MFRGVTSPNAWAFGWEALAATGTIGAVIVALLAPYLERHFARRGDKNLDGSLVDVEFLTYDDYEQSSWKLTNNNKAMVHGFRFNKIHHDPYGYHVEVEHQVEKTILPGMSFEQEVDFEDHLEQMYVQFRDGNGVAWKALAPDEGTAAESWRLVPENETLKSRIEQLLRATYARIRGLFTLNNFKSTGGLLTFTISIVAAFFAGFVTGNGL